MTSKKWSDEELIKFVQLYRQEECLWNIKSQVYRDKNMRSTALQNICVGMNVEGLTIDDVKSKIKSLRSTYYLECDKIEKSSRSGAGGNVYVPKMKWFTELHEFIKIVTMKRKTTNNYSNEDTNNDQPSNAEPTQPILEAEPSEENEPPPPPENKLPTRNPGISKSKRSKLSQMASIVADMKKVNNSLNEKVEDDFDIFGMSVASQIKKLSEEQAIIARGEIQNVLTRCRLTDIRSRNTNFDTASFPNTQFSSSEFVQFIQPPQSSPARSNTSTASSFLGLYNNNYLSPSETEQIDYDSNTDDRNIINDAFNSA